MAKDDTSHDTQPLGETAPVSEAAAVHDEVDDPTARFEAELDVYPIRDPSEDPGWAIKTVWTWIGMCLFSILFITWLLIMSFFYD